MADGSNEGGKSGFTQEFTESDPLLQPSKDGDKNDEVELTALRSAPPGNKERCENDQERRKQPNHQQEHEGQQPPGTPSKFNLVVRLLGCFTVKGIGYVVCALFLICLFLCSVSGLVLYFFCYFGRDEYLFRFLSQVCYRPSFTIIELVVCCAVFKYYCDQPTPPRSWANVFNASLILTNLSKLRPSKRQLCSIVCIFLLCLLVVGVHIVLRILVIMKATCGTKIEKLWYFLDFTEPFFFFFFWYLIYLQRLELKVSQQKIVKAICKPDPENALSDSRYMKYIGEVKLLFVRYYPLRNVIVSLMYLLLFNATFGMSVVLTWNYKKHPTTPLTTSTPVTIGELNRMCPYSCDTPEFMHDRNVFLVYNLFTFWRHLMTIVIPYSCASGLDIEYIWEDLRTDLYSEYPDCPDIDTLKSVTAYTEQFQSKKSYYRLLNILLPLLALFAAILSQRNSNFLE